MTRTHRRLIAILVALALTGCTVVAYAITYREDGAWGVGKGTTLIYSEVDNNFYDLDVARASVSSSVGTLESSMSTAQSDITAIEGQLDGTSIGVTLSLPTINDFTNATHGHSGFAGGGATLTDVDSISLDITATGFTDTVGKIYWNSDDDTLNVGQSNGVVLQVGQEISPLYRNQSGAQIDDGDVVYVVGSTGDHPTVELARADTIATSMVIAVATQDIAHGADGHCTKLGRVRGLTTTGTPESESWSDGDRLYLSATDSGDFTNAEPSSANLVVPVAIVVYAHASEGIIDVGVGQPLATNTSLGTSNAVAPTQGAVKTYVDAGRTTGAIILDGVAGRVLRSSRLLLEDGSASDTVKATLTSNLNGDAIAVVDDIPITGTNNQFFEIGGSQRQFFINNTGLTGDALGVMVSAIASNAAISTTFPDMTVSGEITGTYILMRLRVDGVAERIHQIVDEGNVEIDILYMTDQ